MFSNRRAFLSMTICFLQHHENRKRSPRPPLLVAVLTFYFACWGKLLINCKRSRATLLGVQSKLKSNRFCLSLESEPWFLSFFPQAKVNPKKLYCSVMFSIGTPFTTYLFIINSNEVRHGKKWTPVKLLYMLVFPVWLLHFGNKSTESQISESQFSLNSVFWGNPKDIQI